MSSAPYDLTISAVRVGALFASPLQRSDEPSARQVRQAIRRAPDPAPLGARSSQSGCLSLYNSQMLANATGLGCNCSDDMLTSSRIHMSGHVGVFRPDRYCPRAWQLGIPPGA
jgi:hypothetical protein